MTHMFRKYLSNRGSALFMVLSTMTALMICCMAMYFSVVSSRSTQYAVFNQQQASSTATSLKNSILAALNSEGDGRAYEGNQLAKIMEYMINNDVTTVTTGSNGFEAFGETIDPTELSDLFLNPAYSQAGAYTLTITMLDKDAQIFDFAVTTSMKGVKDVVHAVIEYGGPDSVPAPPAPTQVFAATGYVPNDVFLEGGKFHTDLFFDNEYTYIAAYGGNEKKVYGNLSVGGSLYIYGGYGGALTPANDKPVIYAIRGSYEHFHNAPLEFNQKDGKNLVLVGGNYIIRSTGGVKNADVYVLGNMYDFSNSIETTNVEYFVAGNVYLAENMAGNSNMLDKIHCNGTIYFIKLNSSENIKDIELTGETKKSSVPWSAISGDDYLTKSEMATLLDEKTASNTYYKWIVNMNDIPGGKTHRTLEFMQTTYFSGQDASGNWVGYPVDVVPTIVLKWSETNQGCIIDDITTSGNYFNDITVIIDTGEDEDNIYTLQVQANRDLDGDGVKETFMWQPAKRAGSDVHVNILVKGRGSVVVDIPKGVTYQDDYNTRFMHYGWALLAGKLTEDTTYGTDEDKIIYKTSEFGGTEATILKGYVHTDCKSGDGCSYSEKASGNKCTICDTEKMSKVCTVHGAVNEYCPTCQADKKGDYDGICANHVDRLAIKAYLDSHDDIKQKMLDSKGEIIYPTTNIFLVSCEESADIRLSEKLYPTTEWGGGLEVMGNSFFGFVYAPYMTFKVFTQIGQTGGFKMMGGLTVSDYVFYDSIDVVACWPDKMPTDLMSDESRRNQLSGVATKSWKTTVLG